MANISKSARQDLSCGSIVIVIVGRGLCFGQISWGWKYYPSTNRWWSYLPEAVDTPARLIERQTNNWGSPAASRFLFRYYWHAILYDYRLWRGFFSFLSPFLNFQFPCLICLFFSPSFFMTLVLTGRKGAYKYTIQATGWVRCNGRR